MKDDRLTASTARRRQRLVEALSREGLDAFLVTHRPNVRYLSGFTGTAGWLWLTADGATLLTDGRYAEQARAQVDGDLGVETGPRPDDCLEARLEGTNGGPLRAGLEAARVSVKLWRRLEELDADWAETRDLVEGLRGVKDDDEIRTIRRALAVAEAALGEVAATLRPGMTEREIAAELEYAGRRHGADAMAFDTIVATGPRTALPHGVAGDRRLLEDEPVMIDMGCVVDGYCSDVTRMLWARGSGRSGARAREDFEEYRKIHRIVDDARRAALDAVAPGVAARDVDAAARRILATAGLEEGFVHGAGHGVGLEIHETPALSPRSEDRLEEGMVTTLEPAVYLPGRFGVRIEDMVAVSGAGARRLTTLETEPILA